MKRAALLAQEVTSYGRLVRFSHSVFALPFALQGAWLAARGVPPASKLVWIVLAAVLARTAAMGFNRLADRELDARNPRTRSRELPAGVLSPGNVKALVIASSVLFIAVAFALNPLCGMLSPGVLAVLFAYSFTKRFTWWSHGVLGLSLGLAPPAAWLAVRGQVGAEAAASLLLGAAVLTWVAGFDLIYACQDAEHDRRERLHSVPARFGVRSALLAARAAHVLTVLLLALVWQRADLGWIYALAILAAAGLLVWEHSLVRHDDLSRVDLAFFTLNGWIGVGLFAGLALDLALELAIAGV